MALAFHLRKPPQQRYVPFVSEIKIEHNIPRPESLSEGKLLKYPFNKMAVGESFRVPLEDDPTGTKTRSAASGYHRRHRDYRFRVSADRESGWRVWRVANPSPEKTSIFPPKFSEGGFATIYPILSAATAEVEEFMKTGEVGPLLAAAAKSAGVSMEDYKEDGK